MNRDDKSMRTLLNIPTQPVFSLVENVIQNISAPEIITLDIHTLIDNRRGIINVVENSIDKLDFIVLIVICDWLYDWYKKNNHHILSDRLLANFTYILSLANDKRETIR